MWLVAAIILFLVATKFVANQGSMYEWLIKAARTSVPRLQGESVMGLNPMSDWKHGVMEKWSLYVPQVIGTFMFLHTGSFISPFLHYSMAACTSG
jgi:hypothetical protein